MLLLPDKPYFGLIERRIPSPGETASKIAISIEKDEQEAIGKEIAKRRIRLGANLEQVTKDVKREVLSKSDVYCLQVTAYSSSRISIRRLLIGVKMSKLAESTNQSCFDMHGIHCSCVILKRGI